MKRLVILLLILSGCSVGEDILENEEQRFFGDMCAMFGKTECVYIRVPSSEKCAEQIKLYEESYGDCNSVCLLNPYSKTEKEYVIACEERNFKEAEK